MNLDLQKGRIIIKPLGFREVSDDLRDDEDVQYAVSMDWLKISKTKPKIDPEGVPPAVLEYFDPSKGLDMHEVKSMLDKSRAKYKPADFVAFPEDPLEDKREIPVVKSTYVEPERPEEEKKKAPIYKAPAHEEIKPEDVKAALGKVEEEVKPVEKASRKKKTEDLGQFT
jgi:hypothetical protein